MMPDTYLTRAGLDKLKELNPDASQDEILAVVREEGIAVLPHIIGRNDADN